MALSRRHFLQVAAGAGTLMGAGAAPKITRVEAFPVDYPVAGHFKFLARGVRPAVFVKITCESGASGWGQSVPIPSWSYETTESVVSTIEQYLAPVLVGRDPLDIAGAHAAMNRAISPSFSTGMPICKAGIDLALHDLGAKLRGESVWQAWGRKPLPKITLSWTVNTTSLEEIESLVEQGRARGYKNFNVKVAPDPKFDLELCRRVRKLAPKGFLWADANGGYDLETALAAAPKLADAGVDVLEQPVAANRLAGFRELKKQGALPIIMDEGVVSSVELAEFIQLGLLDGVAMKPARTAGLHDARKQVEMVLDRGLMFLGSGLTDPDVSLAASLQLYCAYGLKYPAALNGPQFLDGSFLSRPLAIANGEAMLPQGPGLGAQVDEERVRKAAPAGSRVTTSERFRFADDGAGKLTLEESGRTVFVYNYGPQLKEGVAERYRRACYLHPLYTPDGIVLTDDFPRDHYHHRGLSWMWPVVVIGDRRYNIWEVNGEIRDVFVRWIERSGGRMAVENGWFVGDRKVLKETVDVAAQPAEGTRRRMDLKLTFEALDTPVAIAGTPAENKGYGGLSLRFAPRDKTGIRTDKGLETRDTDMVPHPWAELEGVFQGRRAGARVEDMPSNPQHPNGWCLRHYGFLGVNFPGLKAYAIEPGKPLALAFGVTLWADVAA